MQASRPRQQRRARSRPVRPIGPDDLQLLAPDPATHRDTMYDLIAKVFSAGHGYYNFHRYVRDGYVGQSHYDWAASRVGLVDGQVVTHFGVWDYQTRVGRTGRLRTGGIGVVATHGEFRGRGYMDATIRASVQAMRHLGYDVSILFGIDDFYHRFGYTRAWSDERYTVGANDLPQDPPRGRTFDLPAKPDPAVAKLYNRCHAETTGTAVRPTYRAVHYPGRLNVRCRGWGRSERMIDGYVMYWTERQTLTCIEACGDDAGQALRVLRQAAREAGCGAVQFETLPYASDVARLLRRGNVDVMRRHRKSGGAMIRVINLPQALSNIAPEMSRRLKACPMRDWRGELILRGGDHVAQLTVGKDAAVGVRSSATRSPHVISGGDEIAQLLIGTDDPAEIATAYGLRLTGAAKDLLPVLFPAQHPMLHNVDRY